MGGTQDTRSKVVAPEAIIVKTTEVDRIKEYMQAFILHVLTWGARHRTRTKFPVEPRCSRLLNSTRRRISANVRPTKRNLRLRAQMKHRVERIHCVDGVNAIEIIRLAGFIWCKWLSDVGYLFGHFYIMRMLTFISMVDRRYFSYVSTVQPNGVRNAIISVESFLLCTLHISELF